MPAASMARTSKVWLPAPSAGEIVSGVEQGDQLPPSIRHSKVELPSLELKLKLGVVLLDGSFGLEPIVVFGAVLSTRRLATRLESVFPAVSVATARTS